MAPRPGSKLKRLKPQCSGYVTATGKRCQRSVKGDLDVCQYHEIKAHIMDGREIDRDQARHPDAFEVIEHGGHFVNIEKPTPSMSDDELLADAFMQLEAARRRGIRVMGRGE